MSFYPENENSRKEYRQRSDDDFRNSVYRIESRPGSPRQENEKKIRREIANSNERRRMQSINAGFQSLRALLPKAEGDKLSKAAILQGTVDYVQQLEQEKSFLLSQNIKLTRCVQSSNDSDGSCCNDLPHPPLPKRKRRKTDPIPPLLDEGIGGSASPSSQSESEDRCEIAQLRRQLERERSLRARLEGELGEARLRGAGGGVKGERVDHDYTEHELTPKAPSNHLRSRLTIQEHEFAINTITIPEQPTAETHNVHPEAAQVTQPSYPSDNPLGYRPRHNLSAIVEAIRHVEGYHMFQDDEPLSSPSNQGSASPESDERSFQSQIISRAPVVQNRAGVIVSNTS